MFTHSLKDLPIIKVEKEERKHEIHEEIKEHLHILIPNPPKTYFHTFDKLHKKNFFLYLYYWWIQKSTRFDAKYPRPKKPKYQITWVNRTYKFIMTTYTNVENKNLMWEDFQGSMNS